MKKQIVKVQKSWKYEGKVAVVVKNEKTGKEEIRVRKVYHRKFGTLAGYHINLNCDVYTFNWAENGRDAENINWVGNYKEKTGIFENEEYKPEKKEPEVTPEIKPEVKKSWDGKHEAFDTILACVEADIPVYLHGPAGSGKNFTLQQVAEELEMEFYFTNSVQQEYKITGFIDAGGQFHETEFFKAFKNGGLFFLDELDASIPEVLVLLNAAIANRYFEFPIGKVYAHQDFRVVAAGNTTGDGASEEYTGRLQIDQSTLDRFAFIEFNYDRNVELAIAKGNEELVNFVRELREQAEEMGIRATFSYRCIETVVKLEGKMDIVKVLQIGVFKGMDKDTMGTFNISHTKGKYHAAAFSLQVV